MTKREKQKLKAITTVRDWRGEIIGLTIVLERYMDAYIASYFCNTLEKRNDLMDFIICTDRISFRSKIDVLERILKKSDKEKTHKSAINDLIDIMEKRNMFAHHHAYHDDASVDLFIKDGTISLVKVKNTRQRKTFTYKELTELTDKIRNYTTMFVELNRKT